MWTCVVVVRFFSIAMGEIDQTDSGIPVNAWGFLDISACKKNPDYLLIWKGQEWYLGLQSWGVEKLICCYYGKLLIKVFFYIKKSVKCHKIKDMTLVLNFLTI